MDRKQHWEQVYATRATERVGWYRPHLDISLEWISRYAEDRSTTIIDVGAGASTLVDDLLSAGYESLSLLDISDSALEKVRDRLGRSGHDVFWLNGDVTTMSLPADRFALWHDRAVFHFLIDDNERHAYRKNLAHGLKPGGLLIVGTFSPDAPPTCSGLPVTRYSHRGLSEFFAPEFEIVEQKSEVHVTPGGVEQAFTWCLFRRSEPI